MECVSVVINSKIECSKGKVMKVDYKQNQRGGYQVYLDGSDYGLTFYLPNGYKPEDYKIEFKENERSTLLPCENLNIEFVSPPETTSLIRFDQGANIICEDKDIMFSLKESLELGINTRVLIETNIKPDADGFKRIHRNRLSIKDNYHISLGFLDKGIKSKEIPEKLTHIRLASKRPIIDGEIAHNKNINFVVLANSPLIHLTGNEYNIHRENNEPMLRLFLLCPSATIVATNEFKFPDAKSSINELIFESDFLYWTYSTTYIGGELNKLKLQSDGFTKIENYGMSVMLVESDTTINCENLYFNGGATGELIAMQPRIRTSFFGKNTISCKKALDIVSLVASTSLDQVSIDSKSDKLTISNTPSIFRSEISFKPDDPSTEEVLIEDATLNKCSIKNHRGDLCNIKLAEAILDGCNFNKNAYLNFSYRSELEVEGRDYKDYANIYYNLTNVEVKEGATFKVDMQATWKKAFSNLDYAEGMEFFLNMTNCVINGECELHGFVPNLNNVILDNANLTCNYPLMEANNSVIRDKVELFNIKGVNNSELNKAVVDSSEPIKIDSEIISSNYIPDYVAYLAEKDSSSKNSKISVKDIEIL